MKPLARLLRFLALVGLIGAVVVADWRLTAGPLVDLTQAVGRPSQVINEWTIDRLVVAVGSGLLLVATAGLATMVGLAVGATVAADRAPALAKTCRRLTPSGCRRMVAVLLGFGLVSPAAVGGLAQADQHRPVCVVCPVQPPSLGGLRLPDLPLTHDQPPVPPERILVRPGDSLWRIAERRCGAGASDARVAVLTHRLYALNRATIGDDPDLIFPGMTLLAPEGMT